MWGHSLRKMAPAKEKALFTEFVTRAIAEYSLSDGSLTILGRLGRAGVRRFEHLLGAVAQGGVSFELSPQQVERCLAHVQKLIPIIAWVKGIVPIWEHGMFSKAELVHLVVGDPEATGVKFVQETTVDR